MSAEIYRDGVSCNSDPHRLLTEAVSFIPMAPPAAVEKSSEALQDSAELDDDPILYSCMEEFGAGETEKTKKNDKKGMLTASVFCERYEALLCSQKMIASQHDAYSLRKAFAAADELKNRKAAAIQEKLKKQSADSSESKQERESPRQHEQKRPSTSSLGTLSVLTAGAAVGAAVAAAPVVGALLGGAVASAAYQCVKKHVEGAEGTVESRVNDETVVMITSKIFIEVEYYPVSTGTAGFFKGVAFQLAGGRGVPSTTAGSCTITLGEMEPIRCPFSKKFNGLNDNSIGKIQIDAMANLAKKLDEALKDNILTHDECIKILDALSNIDTANGSVCMIAKECSLFKDIRNRTIPTHSFI